MEALRTVDDGRRPKLALSGSSPGNGTGRVTVEVDASGHKVDKTVLFLDELELASAQGAGLKYDGPLPKGKSRFRARIVYDRNHTADSEPFTLAVTGQPVGAPWALRNVGDSSDSAGVWQTADDAFEFFGRGLHTLMQPVTGDFTATMRLDACSGLDGAPVNPASWVGLAAFERPGGPRWVWGQHFYLVQTAGNGLRAAPDFGDGAATRVSSYALPAGRPWLRIARQANVWTAWTSTDGKDWDLGAYQFRRTPERMHVGLFFRALRQESRAHFRARVSRFSIKPGVDRAAVPPVPPVARNTGGRRLTGVVMARSDADVVVVRSSAFGLARITDGGKTWTPANGNLTGDDLAVRSVAIHPRDPRIMLRACGTGSGRGRLWKSADGGRSWKRLPFTGDFDGTGPSALCGEVVAFDVYHPDTLCAGTESKGFFRSTDGGATWKALKLESGKGLAGHRITSVTQWPWLKHYPSKGSRPRVCLTTAGDHWMEFLGRGKPKTATRPRTSLIVFSREDRVELLQVRHRRTDTGIYNAMNPKAVIEFAGECRFGTTHGLQSEYVGYSMTVYPEGKHLEWLRPMTALAPAARGDRHLGRAIAQVLDPQEPGRLSRSHAWAFTWQWLTPRGDAPKGGLIAVCGDEQLGKKWWFVYTDGLYFSPDGGATMHRMMNPFGK